MRRRPCGPEHQTIQFAHQAAECIGCVFSNVVDEKLFTSQPPERSFTPEGYPQWVALVLSDATIDADSQAVEEMNASERKSDDEMTEVDTDEMEELEKLATSYNDQIDLGKLSSSVNKFEGQWESVAIPVVQPIPKTLEAQIANKDIWTRSRERAAMYAPPTTQNKRKYQIASTEAKANKRQQR
jgi:hypothetical protein